MGVAWYTARYKNGKDVMNNGGGEGAGLVIISYCWLSYKQPISTLANHTRRANCDD